MVSYFGVVTVFLGNKSYTVGQPVYFPLNGATFVGKRIHELSVWATPMLLCQYQTAYSAVDFCLVSFIRLDDFV